MQMKRESLHQAMILSTTPSMLISLTTEVSRISHVSPRILISLMTYRWTAGPGGLPAASGQGITTTPNSYEMPQPSFLLDTDAALDVSFNPSTRFKATSPLADGVRPQALLPQCS